MNNFKIKSYCKINLSLKVLEKLSNGYHNIESLVTFCNLYDLILVIKYNMLPTIPYKGSAIFIHVAKKNYSPTKGCIALDKNDFKEILFTLKPSDKIKISDN